ncbi:efflux RND transporter periplasmic adaptor subunit [Campylobacter concisus]|uniref:efflux RND transporter periplasmic adaptor subunit n=1 Tax=Campylobacter concisus TaxID=199 RepID=UPI000CD91E99|nr:efflux RND transporter periplasmic adaptor subunit [Campylobacter concisus]QPH87374.1 efflux RND transporter periplasmic adaptor subunit [Campylobacter concisus]QPI02321.1 efflux RND transporter periplasmic adaptor subunit [Campylobacter concisus]
MLKFKSFLVLSAAVFLFSGCFESGDKKAAAGRQMPLSHVDIFTAQKTDIPISFDYTATVASSQDVIIYPKVGGTIIKQFFRPGSKVKAGDKLFLIDPEKYQASFDSLDAAVGVANANLKNAETEFKRISALYKKNAVSQKDYDAAVAAYDIANANLVSAKANLKNAKIDLGYTTIIAPFDGVVGDNQVDVGSLVIANQTKLVRLTKINPIEAEFYIADVDNLTRKTNLDNGSWQQLNSDAVLSVNGENFNGKVNFIDNVVNTATGSVLAKASFDNSEGKILPGAFGHIKMSGFVQKNAFNIPQVALQQSATNSYVLVVKDGKVSQKNVKTGYQTKNMVAVTEGLEDGDKIIVNNFLKIGVGAPVETDKDLSAEFINGKDTNATSSK